MATLKLSDPTSLVEAHERVWESNHPDIEQAVSEACVELGLDVEEMESETTEILAQEIGADTDAYLRALITQALNAGEAEPASAGPAVRLQRTLDILDSIAGLEDQGEQHETAVDRAFDPLQKVLETRLESRASQLANMVREWTFQYADRSDSRLDGAKCAAELFQAHIRAVHLAAGAREKSLGKEAEELRTSIISTNEDLGRITKPGRSTARHAKWCNEVMPRLVEYGNLRLREVIAGAVCRWAVVTEARVTSVSDGLRETWRDLNRLADEFDSSDILSRAIKNDSRSRAISGHWDRHIKRLIQCRPELIQYLELVLEKTHFNNKGKLGFLLSGNVDVRDALPGQMRELARSVVLRAMQMINLESLRTEEGAPSRDEFLELQNSLNESIPYFFAPDAAKRLLLVLPESGEQSRLRDALDETFDHAATMIEVPKGDFVACYEFEGQPLADVANNMIKHRKDYAQVAEQLHSRCDVKWAPVFIRRGPRETE